MIEIDNRGTEHQTESEVFLRERVEALKQRVKDLEKELLTMTNAYYEACNHTPVL